MGLKGPEAYVQKEEMEIIRGLHEGPSWVCHALEITHNGDNELEMSFLKIGP